jgi:hypothetical protein
LLNPRCPFDFPCTTHVHHWKGSCTLHMLVIHPWSVLQYTYKIASEIIFSRIINANSITEITGIISYAYIS